MEKKLYEARELEVSEFETSDAMATSDPCQDT